MEKIQVQPAGTEKYDPLKLKEARQIGENILREGIPGDPMVNWVWSQLR